MIAKFMKKIRNSFNNTDVADLRKALNVQMRINSDLDERLVELEHGIRLLTVDINEIRRTELNRFSL